MGPPGHSTPAPRSARLGGGPMFPGTAQACHLIHHGMESHGCSDLLCLLDFVFRIAVIRLQCVSDVRYPRCGQPCHAGADLFGDLRRGPGTEPEQRLLHAGRHRRDLFELRNSTKGGGRKAGESGDAGPRIEIEDRIPAGEEYPIEQSPPARPACKGHRVVQQHSLRSPRQFHLLGEGLCQRTLKRFSPAVEGGLRTDSASPGSDEDRHMPQVLPVRIIHCP